MSKHVKTKTPYTKINRNSLGQFFRSIERWFWMAGFIIPPEQREGKDGRMITVPASVRKPGVTYQKPKE